MAEIVQLRESPSLMDVPGQLRALADRLDAGEHGEVGVAYVVVPTDTLPTTFGFGAVDDPQNNPIILLNLALHAMYKMAEG